MANDPTYIQEIIEKNPVFHAAFIMSEHLNDDAPIGWGSYIPIAESLVRAGLITKEPREFPDIPHAKNLRIPRVGE